MADSQFLIDAIRYTSMGFSIIPSHCKYYASDEHESKKPLLHYWHPYMKRKPTIMEISMWAKKWPKAGIAIVGGAVSSNIVIVDVDPKNGGDKSIKGLHLPPTLVSSSGGGGWHYIYRVTQTYPTRKGDTELKGIDLICENNCAISPNSIHYSGRPYEDLIEEPISNAPRWVVDRLSIGRPDLYPYGPKLVYQGERNNYLFSKGCGFARNRGVFTQRLFAWLWQTNLNNCRPPLEICEVRELTKHILKTINTYR